MIRDKLAPVIWLLLAAVLIGASVGLAARANAGPNEDRAFIKPLDEFGVPYDRSDPQGAIRAGHTVCEWFDQGDTFTDVLVRLMIQLNWPPSHASHAIGASIGAFCVEHESVLDQPKSRLA